MAKLRSILKINWGGFNPSILNHIEIEIKEISRNISEVVFQITDTVIAENEYQGENNEVLINEYAYQVIRSKRFSVPIALYNQLFATIESQLPAGLTPFEKYKLIPEQASLYYYQNDKLANDLCGYNTQPEDWQII